MTRVMVAATTFASGCLFLGPIVRAPDWWEVECDSSFTCEGRIKVDIYSLLDSDCPYYDDYTNEVDCDALPA